jgi:hypothetical protein
VLVIGGTAEDTESVPNTASLTKPDRTGDGEIDEEVGVKPLAGRSPSKPEPVR